MAVVAIIAGLLLCGLFVAYLLVYVLHGRASFCESAEKVVGKTVVITGTRLAAFVNDSSLPLGLGLAGPGAGLGLGLALGRWGWALPCLGLGRAGLSLSLASSLDPAAGSRVSAPVS